MFILYFNAAKISIKPFSFIYFMVSSVSQRDVLLSFLYPVKGGYGASHIYIQTITSCYPFKVPTLIKYSLCMQTFNNRSFSAMDMFVDAMDGYVLRTHTHASQRLTGQAFALMH